MNQLETALRIKTQTEGEDRISALADKVDGLGSAAARAGEQFSDIEIRQLADAIGAVGLDSFIAEIERLSASGDALSPMFKSLADELRGIESAVDQSDSSVRKFSAAARQSADDMAVAADAAGDFEGKLSSVAKALVGVFAAGGLKNLAGSMIETADSYGQMASRIKMATSNSTEYERVQARLLSTAQGTYRPLEEAQELYIRTADALRGMGYSTEQALDASDSLSYLFVTNATAADKAAAAINAFSKSIQTGKIDADGWRSLLAATPSIVDSIAAATGKSADEIRRLGASGKLAAQELTEIGRAHV